MNTLELLALSAENRPNAESSNTQLEKRLQRMERRLYATWAVAVMGIFVAFVLGRQPAGVAQTIGITLTSLNNAIISLQGRATALETKTASMSTLTDASTGKPTVRFTGVNVQIVSGGGQTSDGVTGTGTPLGLGNLIIGYNALRGDGTDNRTGSHNLILGDDNDYQAYGGIVAGVHDTIGGRDSSNNITGGFSCVTGGDYNSATADYSSISGGILGVASGLSSSVSGGNTNTASFNCTSVSGGSSNTASGVNSSVSGGNHNIASGDLSSVSGGYYCVSSGISASVSGGNTNTASFNCASVSGGFDNIASGDVSSVSGGAQNVASGNRSTVSGGAINTASGDTTTISGGISLSSSTSREWIGGSYHTP